MGEAFQPEVINPPAVTADRLRHHIDAIRKLKDEAKQISDAVAFKFAELRAEGFDREVVRMMLRRMESDPAELTEKDSLLYLYESWVRGDGPAEDAQLLHHVALDVAARKRDAA